MKTLLSQTTLVLLAVALFGGASAGTSSNAGGHEEDHVIVKPANLKWGPAPPSLPSGAQVAVLVGDPTKASGSFAIRVKMPDGYQVPPHWHPTDENVTIIQGTLLVGRGEKLDLQKTEELPAGSFMRMPKTMRHFAVAKGETIIQVHGVGPFEVNYVNAGDDPRKKK